MKPRDIVLVGGEHDGVMLDGMVSAGIALQNGTYKETGRFNEDGREILEFCCEIVRGDWDLFSNDEIAKAWKAWPD